MNEIDKALRVLREGGIIVYPTDTLYALGACIGNVDAVEKVYRIKKRPVKFHLPVAVGSLEEIDSIAFMSIAAREIAKKFMPGAITLILEKKERVPEIVAGSKVAVRIPDHPVSLALASTAGPITATSANVHGETPPSDIGAAKKQFGDNVDLYIDGGTVGSVPSTIVDVTGIAPKIIREGAIKKEEII